MQWLRRYYWALWVAFALQVIGGFWDGRWHKAHGHLSDMPNVLLAHTIMAVAALGALIVPALAFRYWDDLRSSWLLTVGFSVTLIFGFALVVGLGWDTLLHLSRLPGNGAVAHQLRTLGLYGQTLGLILVAAVFSMSSEGASPSKVPKS